MKKKIYWRQLLAILIANILITVLVVMLNNVWIVPIVKHQHDQIIELESKSAEKAEIGDGNVQETVLTELEQFQKNVTILIARLQETQATLRDKIAELERKLSLGIIELNTTKASSDSVEQLSSDLSSDIFQLNTVKASRGDVENLSEAMTQLIASKVDKADFELLANNVSFLIETTDEVIREQISELSGTLLDQNHYNELKNDIEGLESSKANQMDFEDLVSTITELANSTVKNRDFLQLLETVSSKATIVSVEQLSSELSIAREDIVNLNTTKASRVALDNAVTRLDTSKADKEEFEILASNVTSLKETLEEELSELSYISLNQTHYDQLQGGIDRLESLKANQTDLEDLGSTVAVLANSTVGTSDFLQLLETVDSKASSDSLEQLSSEVSITREELANLNTTKASRVALDNAVTQLDTSKADKEEFEILVSNVTLLRETTFRADELLRQRLSELSDSTLDQVHYNELQSGIDRLESSKANQTDLEELASTVTALAENSVTTSNFLLLSRTVDGIENNTIDLQQQDLQLVSTVTTLEDTTTNINDLLATKADQQDVDSLRESLETLSETTVQTSTFEQRVETLKSGKADQSDLDELEHQVDHLDEEVEEIDDEISSLDTRFENHISNAQQAHGTFTSDIGANDRDIQLNTDKIENIEGDVRELQTASTPGLTASWIITSSVAAVVTVYIVWHLY